jgi:hypothetical protein
MLSYCDSHRIYKLASVNKDDSDCAYALGPLTKAVNATILLTGSFLAAFLLSFTSLVSANDWMFVARSGTSLYEVRAGSFEHVLTAEQDPAAIALFRVSDFDGANKKITFVRLYVRPADCNAGFGKLGGTDVKGNPTDQNDFVIGGGNIASSLAEFICMAESQIQQKSQKERGKSAF